MELLSPAGNIEKLRYCYAYGADAAYIGLKNFSLRAKADNFYEDEYKQVAAIKAAYPGRRLHCALNIAFHNSEIDRLKAELPYFRRYPIDAFIVQDLGIVPLLQKEFPGAALHLSTQASCMNREAAKVYRSLGFSRVVMGREAGLAEIAEIKDAVPEMEIECFVHGAMCIAYAGRCLMSAYLSGRSAQEGFCSHSCRWDYNLELDRAWLDGEAAKIVAESGALCLKEKKRPGESFPIYEGERFTAVLSSKDLCMVDSLADFQKAGVDSLKIEGRMKSVYYVALVTRAYRKALDALEGRIGKEEAAPFVAELHRVPHRPYGRGFYYDPAEADVAVSGESSSPYELSAQVGAPLAPQEARQVFSRAAALRRRRQEEYDALVPQAKAAYDERVKNCPDRYLPPLERKEGWRLYAVRLQNMLRQESLLEAVGADFVSRPLPPGSWQLVNPEAGTVYRWCCDGHPAVLYTSADLGEDVLLRSAVVREA